MKILYVSTVSNTINAFLIPHIKFLIEKGHQVDVACFINQKLRDELLDLNVNVHNIPFSRKPYSLSNLKAYKILKRVIKDERYEVIHSHTPIASFISRLITRKSLSIKRIYTAHGFHFYKGAPILNWLLYYPIEKYLSKYTDVLITINQEDYKIASKKMYAKKNILMHGVGINLDKFNHDTDIIMKKELLNIHPDTFVILSVGELNKNKNHQLVIKALREINYIDFKYIICGQGLLKDKLINLSKKCNIEDKISFLGFREDIKAIMSIADLFVMPSKREGLPVSILEAFAVGLPVIGSKARGVSDLLKVQNLYIGFNSNNPLQVSVQIKKFYNDYYIKKKKVSYIDLSKYDIELIKQEVYKSIQN